MEFFTSPWFILFLSLVVVATAALAAYSYTLLAKVKKQRDALMVKGDMNLEEILNDHARALSEHEGSLSEIHAICEHLNKMAAQSIQKVGVIRFNAFAHEGEGGEQSFAIALLNQNDDGLVLSSLFARAEMRVYSKPVRGGVSDHHLSAEEQKAIQKAKDNYKG